MLESNFGEVKNHLGSILAEAAVEDAVLTYSDMQSSVHCTGTIAIVKPLVSGAMLN